MKLLAYLIVGFIVLEILDGELPRSSSSSLDGTHGPDPSRGNSYGAGI